MMLGIFGGKTTEADYLNYLNYPSINHNKYQYATSRNSYHNNISIDNISI